MDLCCDHVWPADPVCEAWGFKSGWHGCSKPPEHRERKRDKCICKCNQHPLRSLKV